MRRKREGQATALMFLASFLWGSSFVGSKICLNAGMFPLEAVFYRMLISVIGIGVLFHRDLRNWTPSALKAGLAAGVVTAAIYTAEMYGIRMIEPTAASFLTSMNIIMMPFLSALFLKNRLERRSFLSAAIAMSGVALLTLTGTETISFSMGHLLLLLAAFGYAMSSIVVVRFGEEASPLQITFLQLLTTMIYTGAMTVFQGRGSNYPPQAIVALLYLTVGPTLICFLIKNYSLQYLSPLRCTMILSTEGIFCALLSIIILHDHVTLRVLAGISLIVMGILIESAMPHFHGHVRKED